MYTTDNNDTFHVGYEGYEPGGPKYTGGTTPELMWIEAFRPYYEHGDVRVCPSAKKPGIYSDGSANSAQDYSRLAWGIWAVDFGFTRQFSFPPVAIFVKINPTGQLRFFRRAFGLGFGFFSYKRLRIIKRLYEKLYDRTSLANSKI